MSKVFSIHSFVSGMFHVDCVSQGERAALEKEKESLQRQLEEYRRECENEKNINRMHMQQLEEKRAEVEAIRELLN